MTKPICVVKISFDLVKRHGQTMAECCIDSQRHLEEKMQDYHVFVVPQASDAKGEPITFQTFYTRDLEPIEIKGLKDMIENTLNEISRHL